MLLKERGGDGVGQGSLTDGNARGDPIDFELGFGQVIKGQALIFFFSISFVCSFGARNHSLMAPCLTQAIYPRGSSFEFALG
jgi:hypothetical protein